MLTNSIQNDANSGWLYHVGDSIFGNVLLINAEGLESVFSIYASHVSLVSLNNILKQNVSDNSYDCILVNETDNPSLNSKQYKELSRVLNGSGVIVVISKNKACLMNITKIYYPLWIFKRIFSLLNFMNILKIDGFTESKRFYLNSFNGRVNEVFYCQGYKPVKNSFLFKEKIKKILFSKYLYPIFSSNDMYIFKKTDSIHVTAIKKIRLKVSAETGIQFFDVNRCLILPYKVILSIAGKDDEKYIFLLLRGASKNIRANHELDILNYLNIKYPYLTPYIGKCITSGFYKNIEYIVYKELQGVLIDSDFPEYNVAEKSAYNMLIKFGDISKKNIEITAGICGDLIDTWFDRLNKCYYDDEQYTSFLDKIYIYIKGEMIKWNNVLVLFHGDYKIENILFDHEDYSITGVIDWDLSVKYHLPGLDLLYLILYSRRIKNSTSFIKECENVVIGGGFDEHESQLIKRYREHFNITHGEFKVIFICFIIHHFSCREQCEFPRSWLMLILDNIKI